MKNLHFKQLLLLSNSQKSGNLFKFKKKHNLIIADDNSVGKSTLVKLPLWALGCEPVLDTKWSTLECKVLLKFSLDGEDYSVMRHSNIIYWKKANGKYKKYTGITGEYSKMFADLVNFKALLPNRSENAELVTPPPSFYFLPFYIDQKKSWTLAWENFENLGQFSSWKPTVIRYHIGYFTSKYFEYEEEYYKEQIKIKGLNDSIQKIDYALEVVSEHVSNKEITLDKKVFDKMTVEIQQELSILSKEQETSLGNLSSLTSDKVYVEHQKIMAEHLMEELDKDYVFSVENIQDDDVECPLCGTVHENTIVNRASILADKEQAAYQLENIIKRLNSISKKIQKQKNKINNIKIKIDDINAKYMIIDDSQDIPLNEVIEKFAYQSIDRNINNTKKEKLVNVDKAKSIQKDIKKDQKKLLTKERKEKINNSFIDLLATYMNILDVEEINLSKIKTPLDYREIIKEGGAAEGTRGILSYYLAVFSLVDIYGEEFKAPLIIDTPNQQEQSDVNYENIINLITTKIPDGEQVILCAMENEILNDFKKNANVIKLDSNKLLSTSKYEEIKIIFDEIENED
ncbi:MAG: hypothetical protein LGB58_07395 [Sulfurovum sp.]|nr:hypothetical protein [Sulfurovum sp.]